MQLFQFVKLVSDAMLTPSEVLFCQRAMNRRFLFALWALVAAGSASAQNEHFDWLGSDAQPLPTDSIDDLPYSGEANDFSGGYAIGDTVGDFHLWTLNGNEFILSNEVEETKPTILFNGSATCVRFQNDWDLMEAVSPIQWVTQHFDMFNWVPVYVAEAHALDMENCPSNCPDFPIPGPHGEYMLQHRTVQERLDAAQIVMDWMGPGSDTNWNFPFDDILIDSPDNLMYTHYFMRPAGIVVIDCDGVVVARGDWFGTYLNDYTNRQFLIDLVENPEVSSAECLLVSDSEEPCGADMLDSDGDGVCDAAELLWGTDPFNPCDLGSEGIDDTDGDGACDALEAYVGSDPNNPCDPVGVDTDGDGFCDIEEELMGSNPFNACSPSNSDADEDGYCDNEELVMGSDMNDPCSPDGTDSDMDGLCNSAEIANGTDPNNTCDPLGEDTDADGLCDQIELIIGSSTEDPCDPYHEDADGDGHCDVTEILEGWDPADACSPDGGDLDGDGWCDGIERANGWNEIDPCSPVVTDTDADGWCDMEELLSGWDPEDPCSPSATDTDGDGLCDVFEELNGSSPFSAESVLGLDGLETEAVSVAWIGSGFSVECDGCLGLPWRLFDLTGRTVQQGRIEAFNGVTVPAGSYVLVLPTVGHQEVLPVQY